MWLSKFEKLEWKQESKDRDKELRIQKKQKEKYTDWDAEWENLDKIRRKEVWESRSEERAGNILSLSLYLKK